MSEPTFPKADPADPVFWDMRYRGGFTPWDPGRAPAALREFISAHPPGRVLVPGCGAAHDVRLFAESGWEVLGIDFSETALAAAQALLGSHAHRVRLADFFAPGLGEPFDLLYERAFLCALPRRLWPAWGRRVAELLGPGGVLAGFFYFNAGERGPPFPLHSQGGLDALLVPAMAQIEDRSVEDSIAAFRGCERWQVWRKP
jgi:SAM-dependent methyltransferase